MIYPILKMATINEINCVIAVTLFDFNLSSQQYLLMLLKKENGFLMIFERL